APCRGRERGIWHWCRVNPYSFPWSRQTHAPRMCRRSSAAPAARRMTEEAFKMTSQLEHGFADLGDVTLHYVTAGQGPPIVLIHGWPQTWFMWRDIIAGLACNYRVVAPDLRGLGESSRPVAGYDKKTMSNDIWRLAHDVLGEKRLFVVGHDWGGPTAFSLAAQ